ALAAGLLGSAFGKAWVRSVLLACMCALLGLAAFVFILGFCLVTVLQSAARSGRMAMYGPGSFDRIAGAGFFAATNMGGSWKQIFAMVPPRSQWELVAGMSVIAAVSMFVLALVVMVAAWLVRRSWQEGPPSPRLTQ